MYIYCNITCFELYLILSRKIRFNHFSVGKAKMWKGRIRNTHILVPLQVQLRNVVVQQEGSSSMTRHWYLIWSMTRPRKHPWRSRHLNTRRWRRGSPAGGRSYYGTLPPTSLCPQQTTAQTSQQCPAVTLDRLFAGATRWAEGGKSHTHKHSYKRLKEKHTDVSKQMWRQISPFDVLSCLFV